LSIGEKGSGMDEWDGTMEKWRDGRRRMEMGV
jgi:hypothetical protein